MIVVLGRPENGLDRNGYMKSNGQLFHFFFFFCSGLEIKVRNQWRYYFSINNSLYWADTRNFIKAIKGTLGKCPINREY